MTGLFKPPKLVYLTVGIRNLVVSSDEEVKDIIRVYPLQKNVMKFYLAKESGSNY